MLPRGVQQTLTTNKMKEFFLKTDSKLMLMLALLLVPGPGILAAQDAAAEPEKERDSTAAQEPAPTHKRKRQPERHRETRREEIVFGNDVVIQENESAGQVVVIAGNARIDGNVDGDVVVVSGSATVRGRIDGQLVVVMGSAKLGPQAEVVGQVVTVGGALDTDPNAQIGGQRVAVDLGSWFPEFTWLKDWFKHGFLRARPLPPHVGWIWVVAAICFVIYLMLALLFPGSVQASIQALELRPVGSFFVGVLFFLLIGPLVFLLVVSVVGVLIIPFLVCAMIAAFFFGKLVVYRYTGYQIVQQLGVTALQLPLVGLLIGTAIFYLLYTIPVLGFVVWGVITPLGVGAVLLAAFGLYRREATPPTTPGPSASSGPAPATPPPASSAQSALTLSDVASYPKAGFWLRLCATILDALIIGVSLKLLHVLELFPIVWGAYHIAMWTWKGTTVGGMMIRIKIVSKDGRPIHFAEALVRCLSSVISAMALLIGFFWAGWDREKQSWHDKIAGTIVVRMPREISLVSSPDSRPI